MVALGIWVYISIESRFPSEVSSILNPLWSITSVAIAILAAFNEVMNLSERIKDYQKIQLFNDKLGLGGRYDEATIEQSIRYYVRPKCSNLDPAQERELRHALFATREDLFGRIDYFLDHDDSQRHLLILADSGMGKTAFTINYLVHNYQRNRGKRKQIALVHLGVKDADDLISKMPDQEHTIIILDALDEDVKAISDHRTRVEDLMLACRSFRKVIITCRTQFFPSDAEIPTETGVARLGPRGAGDKGIYEFWKLYLSPFDDKDVNSYINKHFPLWQLEARKKAHSMTKKIPMLSTRPMLLAHIPELIAANADIQYPSQLYEIMIDAWLIREKQWANKATLREFSERLAVDIYLNRKTRGTERIPKEALPSLAEKWDIKVEIWKLQGRSLLNRDADGNYKFAHRSMMEYLFAYRMVDGDSLCFGVPLTDQMKIFACELLRFDTYYDFMASVDLVVSPNYFDGGYKEVKTSPEFQRLVELNSQRLSIISRVFETIEGNWEILDLFSNEGKARDIMLATGLKDFLAHFIPSLKRRTNKQLAQELSSTIPRLFNNLLNLRQHIDEIADNEKNDLDWSNEPDLTNLASLMEYMLLRNDLTNRLEAIDLNASDRTWSILINVAEKLARYEPSISPNDIRILKAIQQIEWQLGKKNFSFMISKAGNNNGRIIPILPDCTIFALLLRS